MSHPLRVRGLKTLMEFQKFEQTGRTCGCVDETDYLIRTCFHFAVAPLRVRGLKPSGRVANPVNSSRTLAGAWIETIWSRCQPVISSRTLAGAWIETHSVSRAKGSVGSHPLRVRGLKHQTVELLGINGLVAPLAGAWIETYRMSRYLLELRVAPTGGALCKTSIDILVSVTWFLLVSRLKRSCVSIVI